MLKYIKKNLSKIYFVRNLYFLLFKKSETFVSRENLYNSKSKNKILISDNRFNQSGININEVDAEIDKNINSVLGWVPYIKLKTSIFLYHFFSTNYSIRKQILIRFSLVKSSNVVAQKLFWFPCYCVHDFHLKDYFGDNDGDSIFIEAFHPLIKKNHGGSDGHLRAWGKYYSGDECTSTVHTSNLKKFDKFSLKSPQTRNYFSPKFKGKAINISRSKSDIRENYENNKIEVHNGFDVFLDSFNNPKAVWHHGSQYIKNQDTLNKNSKKITQTFWCPPSKRLDPRIAIDDLETGIAGENFFEIFIVKDSVVIKEKKIKFKNFYQSNLSDIFGEQINGPYYVIVSFFYNFKLPYLHVNYDTKSSCGDNVHCHISHLEIKENKVFLKEIDGDRKNARKFFHFSKINNENCYYLVIHVNKFKNINSNELKIRIFTDKNKEYLFTKQLNFKDPIQIFKIQELFDDKNIEISKSGIVQIESIEENYDGSFIRFNPKNDNIAVDHLSGG